jgi:hypothetical protein
MRGPSPVLRSRDVEASGLRKRKQDLVRLVDLEALGRLPNLYDTDGRSNLHRVVWMRWFSPGGRGTWLAVEAAGQTSEGLELQMSKVEDVYSLEDIVFFGWVVSPLGEDCDEWGYWSLSQLLDVPPLYLELDLHFRPTPLSMLVGVDHG